MRREMVADALRAIGQKVTVCGWADSIRRQKRMVFLILRDHTGTIQTTFDQLEGNPAIAGALKSLTEESTVVVEGTVVSNPSVKLGQAEIMIERLEVVNVAAAGLPITDSSSLDLRLDWRYLDLRRPKSRLVMEIQTIAEHAMRQWWIQEGFLEIHSPKFMESPSESGAELFEVKYFDRTAYLAQSPQFYKQMAMAAGLDRVFEVGPVFRANPSFTSRHDTEFTSIDVEVSWIDSHLDVMSVEEQWIQHFLGEIARTAGDRIRELCDKEVVVPTIPFPQVTMAEAYQILAELGHEVAREGKGDLDPQGERLLSQYIKETTGHEFVFVTDYPASVRAFYHMRHDDDPTLTKSFDLLWNGLEVTTGAQREHRYEILARQAIEKGLTLPPIQYYLDFFKYGCPPHGGYGFGLTRMLMILLGLENVREATYLYRGPNRLSP